jgi:hypothetical protein
VSNHDEPCTVAVDFGDEVPRAVFCIPDDPPAVVEEQSGLVFSVSGNSGLIGAL